LAAPKGRLLAGSRQRGELCLRDEGGKPSIPSGGGEKQALKIPINKKIQKKEELKFLPIGYGQGIGTVTDKKKRRI